MSAVEELQAAIEKLTELWDESFPGTWEVLTSGVEGGDHWYVQSEHEAILSVSANDGSDEPFREPTAKLIVTLHRTIAAQLAILADTLNAFSNPIPAFIGYEEQIYHAQLMLARAINGGVRS